MFVAIMILTLASEGPFFEGSIQEVLKHAKENDKLIMVDIYTTWCGPCKLLDRTTFADERVRAFLSGDMVAYKVDAEKGEGVAFARKYKVTAFPNLIIINGDGELVSRQIGYVPPAQFLQWARQAL